MKKIMFLGISVLIIFLVACNQTQELDFRSVRDTETGTVFSLGDDQSRLNRTLGDGNIVPGFEDHEIALYTYADGLLAVKVYQGEIVEMVVSNHLEGYRRFEFYDSPWDLTDEALARYFSDHHVHFRAFDEQGQELVDPFEMEDIHYVIGVTNFYLLSEGLHDRMEIRITNQRFLHEFNAQQ